MTQARIVFLHGLKEELVSLATSSSPPAFSTQSLTHQAPLEQQIEAVRNADFLMLYRAQPHDEVLRAARKVRLVQLLSAGYDGLNLPLLKTLGIPCASNGGANAAAVADQTIMMILALYRGLLHTDRDVRAGRWNAGVDSTASFELGGKTLGILGFGNIGQQVAQRARGFDAVVQYHSRSRLDPERERALGVSYVSLDTLFQTSDILTLHAPLTADTRQLVNAERLHAMKRNAILINTSRGEVIDENALTEALIARRIAGAGLDTFAQEPVAPDNPLLALENVVLTPHSAGTTADSWKRRGRFAYGNFQRVLEGLPPLSMI